MTEIPAMHQIALSFSSPTAWVVLSAKRLFYSRGIVLSLIFRVFSITSRASYLWELPIRELGWPIGRQY
jgi:hypothetical protein